MHESQQPAFSVMSGDQTYWIYADGHVEGYGDDAIVVNRIPLLLEIARQEERKRAGLPLISTPK